MQPQIKKWHWIFLGLFLLLFIVLQLLSFRTPSTKVVLQDQVLRVIVAQTHEARVQGLSDRASLAPYDGMLFLFDQSDEHGFVMRRMQFPLDIIWFQGGVVVDIAPHLQPEHVPEAQLTRYYPRKPANAVLEVPAGWTEANRLKIGDRIEVHE